MSNSNSAQKSDFLMFLVRPAEFVWAEAPLSDVRAPLIAGAVYIALVLLLQRIMRGRKGFEMKYVQV